MAASAEERLKKIIAEQLSVSEDEVTPEANFIDDLNADSLDLVELIMSLEEEFNVKISDEDAERIRTVRTRWTTCTSTAERRLFGPAACADRVRCAGTGWISQASMTLTETSPVPAPSPNGQTEQHAPGDKEMTLLQHLEELRGRLVASVAAVVVGILVAIIPVPGFGSITEFVVNALGRG